MGATTRGELTSLRRNPKIEEAPLHGELMLFDGSVGKFFVLNETMAFLWRHCDGATSFPQMIETLCREFKDVEPQAAETDLDKALEELLSLGLIVPAASVVANA